MSSRRAALSGLKLETLPVRLGGIVGHGFDPVSLGPVAIAGGQAVGPHDGPGGRARLSGHRSGGLDGIDAVLRGDAKKTEDVGVLGRVAGVPVTHLPVLEAPGAVAFLGIRYDAR